VLSRRGCLLRALRRLRWCACVVRLRRSVEMLQGGHLRRGFQALWSHCGEVRDARLQPLRHWSRRQLSAAWDSWRASAAQLRLLSRFVSRARSGRQAAALTSWVSARDLTVGRRRQMTAVRALHGSNERRAWMSWVSRVAELAAISRVMRRSMHRSVWWALSTWRVHVSDCARSHAQLLLATRSIIPFGQATRWALGRWVSAWLRNRELSAFAGSCRV